MRLVVDASVALKWIFPEPDSAQADRLLDRAELLAPELIVCEVSNALWKVARRGQISTEEALLASRAFEHWTLALFPMGGLLVEATRLSIAIDHPAYDCFYLALAAAEAGPLVTADARLGRKVRSSAAEGLPEVWTLPEAALRLT